MIQPSEYPQPIGTVRVYPMPGRQDRDHRGRLDGEHRADDQSPAAADPQGLRPQLRLRRRAGKAHLLNVGQLTVNSGAIGAIEGFHSADLSGPITASSSPTVDRIAFNSIQPGASIVTGGSVNTLDVLQGITLDTRDEHPDRPRP